MHAKGSSLIESNRKLFSRLFAVVIGGVAVFTIPLHFDSIFGESIEILGFLLLIAAAMGRIWCSIYISGRKDRVLCTEGPYSLCRNPLYFFSFLGAIGFACALQSVFLLLAVSAGFLLYYRYVMKSEEVRLSEIFGEEYSSYQATTPRFFPRLKFTKGPDSYLVNPRVIERSMKEVVWFLLVIIGAEALEIIHLNGHLVFGHLWI